MGPPRVQTRPGARCKEAFICGGGQAVDSHQDVWTRLDRIGRRASQTAERGPQRRGALRLGPCRRARQQARSAQPGQAHHAQAPRRGDGRLRQARLPRDPGERRRRNRQDVTRHLLPVLLQQGRPAARPGGRGCRRFEEGLRLVQHTARAGWHAAVGGRARVGAGVLGPLEAQCAPLPRVGRAGHGGPGSRPHHPSHILESLLRPQRPHRTRLLRT